ncbi:MAG: 3-phosphoglycerate dehydrogenase, partial [Salibacteraceae bacterium]
MRILANDGISASGKSKLEDKGFEVITENIPQENLAQGINDGGFVVILVRSATKVRQEHIDACPNLKLIGRGGVGMDNIDVKYARDKGLHVINTPAASSQSVAELA